MTETKAKVSNRSWCKNRWAIAGLVLAVTVLIGATSGCNSETKVADTKLKPVEEKTVPYGVEQVEEMHFSTAKRFVWHVVVTEQATPKELKRIAQKIVSEARSDRPFNALSIMFYDHAAFIGHGYTLGNSIFAPAGDWAKAVDVPTGDYSSMSFSHELRKKDWSQRLTEDEVVVWKAWKTIYEEQSEIDPANVPDEAQVAARVAAETNKTAEEVKAIVMKQVTWTFMDND